MTARKPPTFKSSLFLLGSAVLLAGCFPARPVRGQDLVIYANSEGPGQRRIEGEILDYTGTELVVQRPSGRRETLDTGRVRQVETNWGADYELGAERFAAGKFSDALGAYQAAFKAEPRPWVKRKIAAQLVWCLLDMQRIPRAAAAFEWLYRSDPSTQYFDTIPLAWTPTAGNQGFLADEWLTPEKSVVSRLVAASWLLSTNERASAMRVLRQIEHSDRRIMFLAEAQLWRTQVATLNANLAHNWQSRLEQMPAAIRSGPYYTLGKAWSQLGESDRAALSFLRVPIHFPQQRQLAAHALFAAAAELERAGRQNSAVPLYQELVASHRNSTLLAEAERRLDGLLRNKNGR